MFVKLVSQVTHNNLLVGTFRRNAANAPQLKRWALLVTNTIYQLAVAISLILNSSLVIGDERIKEQEAYFKHVTNAICGNRIYRECIKLSEDQCSNAYQRAISSCPLKYIESSDIKLLDAPCVTDKFIIIAKIPDELAVSCDKIFEVDVKSLKEKLKWKYVLPNNSLIRDVQ